MTIHETHWEHLASLAPDEVCRRTGARYDPARKCYALALLDGSVHVYPKERTVQWGDESHQPGGEPGYNVVLLTTVYLIEAKEIPPAADWVTAESLPTGAFFFRGFHTIPTAEVAARLGHDRELFLKAGIKLGGKPVEWGDACIEIQVLPRIAVRLMFWLGDEEFPSRLTMLFDRRADEHLPLDALLSLARYVTSALIRAVEPPR
ncbi:MAG: DUF3786 domain-containing protein [Chloroflexi bacterium]|nr:DUF3786 domain-containing protein [Chloroflexota bacterium]